MEEKKNIHEITIKFNKEEFANAIDKAFDKNKKDIELDGFRKGKVPKDVYFKKRGKEALYMDAIDILLPDAYDRVFKENKDLRPIIEPKVELRAFSDTEVVFVFTITTMPEVDIKKYTGLKVKKEKVEVTKEEIEHELGHLLERYAEYSIKEEGTVEEGNVAVIDFEGFKDGVAFEGGKGENYSLTIGSNTFIPGFEEQIIGMKKDEEKEINVTFPEDYNAEDLKGQDAVFKVKVNEIKEKVNREMDEEFFEDLGMEGVNSKEELEKEIEENIKANKTQEAENIYIDELLKKIAENTTVEIPEELVEKEIDALVERFEGQLRMQGISLDLFYEITKSDEKALREQMKEEANRHVLYRFILEEIKEKENISVTDEEVNEELEKLAKQYNMTKEELEKEMENIDMFKAELEVRKTLEFLKENN